MMIKAKAVRNGGEWSASKYGSIFTVGLLEGIPADHYHYLLRKTRKGVRYTLRICLYLCRYCKGTHQTVADIDLPDEIYGNEDPRFHWLDQAEMIDRDGLCVHCWLTLWERKHLGAGERFSKHPGEENNCRYCGSSIWPVRTCDCQSNGLPDWGASPWPRRGP